MPVECEYFLLIVQTSKIIKLKQIYDYMNVNSIHNATFARNLPEGYLEQARDLANFHEGGVFSSPQPNGIGNSKLNLFKARSL